MNTKPFLAGRAVITALTCGCAFGPISKDEAQGIIEKNQKFEKDHSMAYNICKFSQYRAQLYTCPKAITRS